MALLGLALTEPVSAGWNGGLALGMRHVTVSEYDSFGSRIVSERGWLPGIEGTLSYEPGVWNTFVMAKTYRETLAYDGRVQSGQSFRSETNTRLDRLQSGLGRMFGETLYGWAGFEYDRWKRDIQGHSGVTGLQEDTSSRRLVVGAQKQFDLPGRIALVTSISVLKAEPERLRARFSTQLDSVTFQTRSATGYRAAIVVRPQDWLGMTFGLELDRMKIGRSGIMTISQNGLPVGLISQPEHVRQHVTITAGYRF